MAKTEWQHAEIQFSPHWNNQVLTCPACHESSLHHGSVRIYDRAEDAKVTTVTVVAEGDDGRIRATTADADSSETDNPSSRRQGLSIAFECENCDAEIEFILAQHTGASCRIGWRFRKSG